MDFLSHCPSLVDILKLLSVTDNARCKLVNRRIRDVMIVNRNAVKPTAARLYISLAQEGEYEYPAIHVVLSESSLCSAWVTDKMVLLLNTTEEKQANCFDFDGIKSSETEYPLDSCEMKIIAHLTKYNDVRSYKNSYNSIENALRKLLGGVLSRCHFAWMSLPGDLPLSWLKVISEAFQKSRSMCHKIRTPLLPGLRPFIELIGCSHLLLISYEETSTVDRILEIAGWDCIKRLSVFSNGNSSPRKSFILLLKLSDWQAGRFCMNRMILSVTDWEGFWTDEKFDDFLSNLDQSGVRETTLKKDNSRAIIIKREMDNRTIELTVTERNDGFKGRIVDFKEKAAKLMD